jgi:ABC-2 type transport system ATP-binding protein
MQLTLDAVSFRYRRRATPVITDLDLSLAPGRTILLGPNGAGKSTLMGIAGTVLRAQSGRVVLDGREVVRARDRAHLRRRLAWMPQAIRPASGLTTREQVALHGWLAGMSRGAAWDASANALDQVGLRPQARTKAAALSGGQRARMGVAQALVHAADGLLLDEPTAALDPDQKDAFAHLLGEVSIGRTVLVSTHDITDLAESYDRVVVLSNGAVRFDGGVDSFLRPGTSLLSPVEAYRRALGA